MTQERHCVIVAKTLEDILAACDRHIRNASMTLMDSIECGDVTSTDNFWCEYMKSGWEDLRADVLEMIKERDIRANWIVPHVPATNICANEGSGNPEVEFPISPADGEIFTDNHGKTWRFFETDSYADWLLMDKEDK